MIPRKYENTGIQPCCLPNLFQVLYHSLGISILTSALDDSFVSKSYGRGNLTNIMGITIRGSKILNTFTIYL